MSDITSVKTKVIEWKINNHNANIVVGNQYKNKFLIKSLFFIGRDKIECWMFFMYQYI